MPELITVECCWNCDYCSSIEEDCICMLHIKANNYPDSKCKDYKNE